MRGVTPLIFVLRGGGEGGGRGEWNGRGKGRVALSLGAYGATMIPSQEYSGKYDGERMSVSGLKEWHLKRLRAFAPSSEAGAGAARSYSLDEEERRKCWENVDLVAFETLPLLHEITAVRQVMYELEAEGASKRDFLTYIYIYNNYYTGITIHY